MREFWNTIQLIFTAVGGWLGWFLGGSDGLLFALIAFVVIGLHNRSDVRYFGQETVQRSRVQGNMQKGAYLRSGRRRAYP